VTGLLQPFVQSILILIILFGSSWGFGQLIPGLGASGSQRGVQVAR
jgi:hypothetical protein